MAVLAEIDFISAAQTPLFLNTPLNSGSHVLQFIYNQTAYVLSPFLAPGQTILQIDASNTSNPLITFDATRSPQGQSGIVTICKPPFESSPRFSGCYNNPAKVDLAFLSTIFGLQFCHCSSKCAELCPPDSYVS